jgi:bifunctional non-homologous end joining protein LigD
MQPMLATAASALPVGPGWAYEFKWDGIRALVDVSHSRTVITSRAQNDIGAGYPELGHFGAGLEDALLDGEIVAFDAGRPSFARLQTRMHLRDPSALTRLAAECPVTFIVFDLLRLYGVDVTSRPLTERRETLERLAEVHSGWTLSPSFDDGPATEAAARQHGLEGVVAKRLASRYRPGLRTADWVKVKFIQRDDFVVVGWEADRTEPGRLSSLLLGCHGRHGLVLAGKVGSGLTVQSAAELQRRLLARASCPLPTPPPRSPGRIVTWAEPSVVVAVQYTTWADDGRLRSPVFRGIREDVGVEDVVQHA